MTLRKLVMLGGALLLAGLLSLLIVSQLALQRLKVNGPVYNDIASSKDLIADILPPPKYVIEPYLEATLALNDPASVGERTKRIDALRTEYDLRQDFWLRQGIDSGLKQGLTQRTHEPAKRFWGTLTHKFLPALERKDLSTAQAVYGELTAAYNEHRAAIDDLVKAAKASIANAETKAEADESSTMTQVWVSSLFMLGLLLAAVFGLIKKVVEPITAMTQTMSGLAKGNLATEVPYLGTKDEIGGMAHALVVFKDALVAKKQAEDHAAAEARSKAHQELREMEDWIKREKPSFEEVTKRALELRRRYLNSEGPAAASSRAP